MWLFLLSVFGALFISALCSLMEAALLSLRPSQIADMSSRWPRIGTVWQRFKAEIERPIAAILILNTAAHTIGVSVAGAEFAGLFGDDWIWLFSLVFTFMMLQFTEIMPKGAGVRYNRQVALWIARPLNLLVQVLLPVVHLVHWINRPFVGKRRQGEPAATLEEIAALAGLARLSNEISPRQERIIKEGTRLSRVKVRAVMRPRVEIDALEIDTPPEEIVGAVVMSGFSRVPVYEGDLDHIVGFIYIKDVLRQLHMGWPIELGKLLRTPPFVPETLPLDRLLQVFRKERTQMAIILDEYGGTVGLVTMEDVLEEFVGEIYDEHRRDEGMEEIARRDETSWFVNGAVNLRDLLEAVGLPQLRPSAPQDVNTVGGLIQWLLDRIPDVGDRASWNGLSLEVIEMEGARIGRVLVKVEQERSASGGG